jgi:hypothetical protein
VRDQMNAILRSDQIHRSVSLKNIKNIRNIQDFNF